DVDGVVTAAGVEGQRSDVGVVDGGAVARHAAGGQYVDVDPGVVLVVESEAVAAGAAGDGHDALDVGQVHCGRADVDGVGAVAQVDRHRFAGGGGLDVDRVVAGAGVEHHGGPVVGDRRA